MGADSSSTDRQQPAPAGGYRLAILGGDAAGTAAAREAARRGVRVALILPEAGRGEPPEPTPLGQQIRRLQWRTGRRSPAWQPEGPGIDLYVGEAFFSGRRGIVVGGREIRFGKAAVASGCGPGPLGVAGAEESDCLRAETLEQLAEVPGRLAVVGCGEEECGWAQAFRRLGSQVHLIAEEEGILPGEEPEVAELLQARFAQDEIRLHLGCQELSLETTGNLRAVVIGREGRKEKVLVDRVLVCPARRPKVEGLGLESAGVAYSDQGVVVGERLQTTNGRVFAAGGACGERFATPEAAAATGVLAVHNALSVTSRRLSQLVIPRGIYTDPGVVQVGLTRGEAAARGMEIDTYRADLCGAEESIAGGRGPGRIAVHVERGTGRIAGATVVADGADELIAPLVLLMTRRWSLAALADVIACCGSRLEALVGLGERWRQSRRGAIGSGLIERWRDWRRRRGGG